MPYTLLCAPLIHVDRHALLLFLLEFFSSLLKDIKAERAKITESDNIRLLAVVKWFLEFFLAARGKELNELRLKGVLEPEYDSLRWRFEMVSEVVERSWVGWVLRRMRMAMDDKVRIVSLRPSASANDALALAKAMD